jgi:hypothetical protein
MERERRKSRGRKEDLTNSEKKNKQKIIKEQL